MLIGELAKRTGVPAKTLRFYEQIGVLPPPGRTPAGYRNYRDDAVDRVAFVRSAQSASLTLTEIRQIIGIRDGGTPPCSHLADLLRTKADAVANQIDELQHLHHQLQHLGQEAADIDPATCDPRNVCDVLTRH